MLYTIEKDITTVDQGIVMHGVNCQGVMNSGVAQSIRHTWPQVYSAYKEIHDQLGQCEDLLGTVHVIRIDEHLSVANCYTQIGYGFTGIHADVEAIEETATKVCQHALALQKDRIYTPTIGCGLGGLSWEQDVSPIFKDLENQFPELNIYVCMI